MNDHTQASIGVSRSDNRPFRRFRCGHSTLLTVLLSGCLAVCLVGFGGLLFSEPAGAVGNNCKATVTANFDGACHSDILWQNSVTQQMAMWFMNGTALGSSGIPTSPGTGWAVVGTGDFDGDGNADIVYQNQTSGAIVIWLMNGATIKNSGSPGSPGTNWSVQGVGKFDTNSNRSGLVLQDINTSTVVIWLIDSTGLAIQSSTVLAAPGANWSVQGVGDFDANGTSDILFRDANTGTLVMWLMSGTTLTSSGVLSTVPGFNWSVQGIGDFDGNGTADILWRDSSSGAAAIWFQSGLTTSSSGVVAVPAADNSTTCCSGVGNGWTIAGVGDYDGNGMSDILWRNANGTVDVWLMDGLTIAGNGTPGSPQTAWQVEAYAPYSCANDILCNLLNGQNTVRASGPYGPGNPAPSPPELPFTWDVGATALAQGWAAECSFSHRPNNPYGESIYASAGEPMTGTDAVQSWAAEAQNYVYSSNTCTSGECGHYTQMVWANTSAVGCAIQVCNTNSPFGASFPTWNFEVCDYSPPGNFNGLKPY